MSGRWRSRWTGSPTAVHLRHGGQVCGQCKFSAQRARVAPGEHAEAVDGARDGRFERCDRRAGSGQLRRGAGGVELGAAAGIEPRPGEFQRLVLVGDVAARHRQALLVAAQFEVAARQLCGNGYLCILQGGFGCLQVRVAGFECTTVAAEEVEFPECIEAGVVTLHIHAHRRRPARLRDAGPCSPRQR